MLFWKINNIQRRKILNPLVYFADYFTTLHRLVFFLTIAEVCSMTCAFFPLSNQLAFYMAMSVSMLHIEETLPKPTKSRMSEKYKDGLRQSWGASTNNEETMGSCQ